MKSLKTILFLILLNLSSPVLGSDSSSVYTVDLNKLLRLTISGKKIISENNVAKQLLQNENETLESELLLEEKELSELRKILSTKDFRSKALAFDEKVSIIRSEQAKKEGNLLKDIRKKETDFFKNVYPILYKVLSERGGLVLLDQRNVIFWDNSVDITDEAIDAINRFYLVGE